MSQVMLDLAQPGCLAVESARGSDGFGVTVAYFSDETAILHWKQNSKHLAAQDLGKKRWYDHYEVRVAEVKRVYSGPAGRT
jgi:heme-degrading monooxygenase HmoA